MPSSEPRPWVASSEDPRFPAPRGPPLLSPKYCRHWPRELGQLGGELVSEPSQRTWPWGWTGGGRVFAPGSDPRAPLQGSSQSSAHPSSITIQGVTPTPTGHMQGDMRLLKQVPPSTRHPLGATPPERCCSLGRQLHPGLHSAPAWHQTGIRRCTLGQTGRKTHKAEITQASRKAH